MEQEQKREREEKGDQESSWLVSIAEQLSKEAKVTKERRGEERRALVPLSYT